MKRKLLSVMKVIIITVLSGSLLEAGWISFKDNHPNQMPEVRLIVSSELSMTLDMRVFGCETRLVDTKDMLNSNNETFTLLTIPESYYSGEIGKPKLPVIRKTIEISSYSSSWKGGIVVNGCQLEVDYGLLYLKE